MPWTSRCPPEGVLTGSFPDFLTVVLTLAGGFSALDLFFQGRESCQLIRRQAVDHFIAGPDVIFLFFCHRKRPAPSGLNLRRYHLFSRLSSQVNRAAVIILGW
jgi:hypothetical protein